MTETETSKSKRQRKYNRDFQKNEVIRYLVKKEPLSFKEEPLQIGILTLILAFVKAKRLISVFSAFFLDDLFVSDEDEGIFYVFSVEWIFPVSRFLLQNA
jgi:hypothetical protein